MVVMAILQPSVDGRKYGDCSHYGQYESGFHPMKIAEIRMIMAVMIIGGEWR